MSIGWRDYYQAAFQESDWTKVEERIQTAEFEIQKALSQDNGGTQEEKDGLVGALNGLKVLRMDVAARLERQSEPRRA